MAIVVRVDKGEWLRREDADAWRSADEQWKKGRPDEGDNGTRSQEHDEPHHPPVLGSRIRILPIASAPDPGMRSRVALARHDGNGDVQTQRAAQAGTRHLLLHRPCTLLAHHPSVSG